MSIKGTTSQLHTPTHFRFQPFLVDVDVEMIQGITKKRAADNPAYMKTIVIEMLLGKPMPKFKHWTVREN